MAPYGARGTEGRETTRVDWAGLALEEAWGRLDSSPLGLSAEEAARRLARFGPNQLPTPKGRSWVLRLLLQFHNVLIYVLLVSGAVTAALGHWVDSGVIMGVVFINAVIGFVQEGRAERALAAVRDMLSLRATVLRGGRRAEIAAELVVPGDVVLLQAGDRVPADLRLTRVRNLHVQEAALTGESLPVAKSVEPVDSATVLGERTSMAHSGTLVTSGQGAGVVVATGRATEIGRISELLTTVETLTTPLLRRLAAFGRWLTAAILSLATISFIVGTQVYGFSARDMFLAAVGLAVAAIPEGLPPIITIALAVGVRRMARRNAIIRRLPAVETLGSVTVICSDKTGTLTRNELTVRSIATAGKHYEVSGTGYDPRGGFTRDGLEVSPQDDPNLLESLQAMALCNDAILRHAEGRWHAEGDPTEAALLVAALKAGIDPNQESKRCPRTDEIPFDSEHRFMATLHHDHARHGAVYVKGAPERLIEMCATERDGGGGRPIRAAYWRKCAEDLADAGQRVLAVAMRPATADHHELAFADIESGLTMLGLFGLIDSPREEAIEAIGQCRTAGIMVKMITGDHALTASAVARELGLADPNAVLSGRDLDTMSNGEFERAVLAVNVFARTTPEHKLRLVEALQNQGHVVAMTGDGVNDAPALKRADIGVAMGIKGTEVAKEAAGMVLADDNFASIARAVREGRVVYDNLKKAIIYVLPTSGGEALAILLAVALGLTLPVTAAQILWINMVTEVTLSLALAFEGAEADVMSRPPRPPREPLLSGFFAWRVVFVSVLMLIGAFGLFIWETENGASVETARTVAVNVLVACEIVYLINMRFMRQSSLGLGALTSNRVVLVAIGLVVALQLAFTYSPVMQRLFATTDLDGAAWGRIAAAAVGLFLLVELEKAVLRRWRRTPA